MRGRAGFTLLEVLVALAVLGLLLGLLTSGVRLGLRAWHTEARVRHARADLDAVDRTLRRLITDMAAGSVGVPPLLAGTAHRLAFTATLPEGAAVAGEADLLLTVDAAHRLVLRWTPHRHVRPLGPPPPAAAATLLDGVARLDLAYWPRLPPWGWRAAWQGPDLPGLVRVRIVFPEGDARHWPEIVAAPLRARLP